MLGLARCSESAPGCNSPAYSLLRTGSPITTRQTPPSRRACQWHRHVGRFPPPSPPYPRHVALQLARHAQLGAWASCKFCRDERDRHPRRNFAPWGNLRRLCGGFIPKILREQGPPQSSRGAEVNDLPFSEGTGTPPRSRIMSLCKSPHLLHDYTRYSPTKPMSWSSVPQET